MVGKRALLLVFLAISPVSPSYSQQVGDISGIKSLGGMPHPVSAALAYWDSLGLSETQVRQLRQISEGLESRMMQLASETFADTSQLWRFWRPGPIDSLALTRSAHDEVAKEVSLLIAMLRSREEVLRVLKPEQWARLNHLVRHRFAAGFRPDPRTRSCTSGGVGGSSTISDQVQLVYSLNFRGDSVHVGTIFVARADERLHNSPRRLSKPRPPEAPYGFSGGTAGRWWLQYDEREHVGWLDAQRIDLGHNNVVLVQGIDRLTKDPDVVGLTRVESPFYSDGCRSADLTQLLKEYILKSARIRAFIETGR